MQMQLISYIVYTLELLQYKERIGKNAGVLYGVQPTEFYIDPGEAYVIRYMYNQLLQTTSLWACQKKSGSNVADDQLHYELLLRH